MDRIDLNGRWRLAKAGDRKTIPATVPGCVHTDLLAAGKIADPFYRDNEKALQWIGRSDWLYWRTFTVPGDILGRRVVLLRCEGLDTIATIRINNRRVGRADNMFRTWEFDVKKFLRPGRNTISVRFDSAERYVAARHRRFPMPGWGRPHEIAGRGWIRKEQCNFGWDWAPVLVTCGIWRDITILAFDGGRLRDVQILQDHSRGGRVGLEVIASADGPGRRGLRAAVRLTYNGRTVAKADAPLGRGRAKVRLLVTKPRLWWPNGLGDQPLYDVALELRDADGAVLDTWTGRIGLRTLRLDRRKDRWGESFRFVVNGVAFFVRGANWVPADVFPTRLGRDDYARLIADAAEANMNMLRVWGGSIYEPDVFYDLCDELGLCVWQDFMFACSAYPAFDEQFMASVAAEARDNVRRLRHHPSMALWCGNNELEQGLVAQRWTDRTMSREDYRRLFEGMLGGIVARLDPQRDYWPSSPHTPHGDRTNPHDPTCGDAHLWAVWFGGQPFEWYRTCAHRFNSEFGFQSFPTPKTVRSYTAGGDRNITSPIMEHHQRSPSGNAIIMTYMLSWFRMPHGFENTLWVSQILQGMAMKYAVEHWRRSMPRGMGTLYWGLNDCWPGTTWSGIDGCGRWRALHYMARTFYAPVLVSVVEDAADGRAEIHVTSDRLEDRAGRVSWRLVTLDGALLAAGSRRVRIPARRNRRVERLDLSDPLACWGAERLLLFVDLRIRGQVVSSNLAMFARPKQMDLPDPGLTTRVRRAGKGAFTVTLRARRPGLWVWLELRGADARFSDNFFHIAPDEKVEVTLQPAKAFTAERLRAALRVRSLVDTYR